MGILPWDDWFYDLDHRRKEVNDLHTKAVSLQDQIQEQIIVFDKDLDVYKTLLAGNAALVIICNALQMDDLLFKDFTVQVDALDTPPSGFLPVEIGSALSELIGSVFVTKAIWQLGKLAKGYFSVAAEEAPELAEDAVAEAVEAGAEAGIEVGVEEATEITAETVGESVTEAAAEAAVEGASLSGLAATGIGIFAAVGIDAVFGAIDGAKEAHELDKAIDSLQTAVNKSQTYYNRVAAAMARLDGATVGEEERFIGLVDAIGKIGNNPPTFAYKFPMTTANAHLFVDATQKALKQYSAFVQMRNMWVSFVDRQPSATKDTFIPTYLMFAPTNITLEIASQYWDTLAKYSDSMKAHATV